MKTHGLPSRAALVDENQRLRDRHDEMKRQLTKALDEIVRLQRMLNRKEGA